MSNASTSPVPATSAALARARAARAGVLILLGLGAGLSGCASVKETIKGPQFSQMSYPSALVPTDQAVLIPADGPRPGSANSVWRNGARTFFHDQRASHVGDILTVLVTVSDSAQVADETVANRQSSASLGLTNLFGFESSLGRLLPKAFNPASALNTNSNNQSDGKGSINRSEAITLTIAAVVTKVLPNGNLVISGDQEVKVNSELRQLTVAGIVRPEDITASNTINHTQIAEARVNYGGKGVLTSTQNPPVGQQLVTKFSPF
jgi:flagellar L-ring protein precursor FlgH